MPSQDKVQQATREKLKAARSRLEELRKLQARLKKEFPEADDPGNISGKIDSAINQIAKLEVLLII